ncbi:MAG: hypothetical protein GTO28_04220, partial [Gammaproteobacteria bacterium]|nr:hypothetical protein [Gammaproteobacteria bacterium]NIO24090.1 hypothetical protein [Gammaproteobacteria bacterium]NIO64740.1 hypothetical protein [Gammaproteobacteria bacterium]NIP63513.1 hypothetical protein [Gammaproteobacteria bacterium]NIQ25919.1 hypothetical protein [Gammaproteobacteria bacterium]
AAGTATSEEEIHSLWQSFVSENSGAFIQLDDLRANEMLADALDMEPAEKILRQLTELGSVEGNVFDRRREELAALSAG